MQYFNIISGRNTPYSCRGHVQPYARHGGQEVRATLRKS